MKLITYITHATTHTHTHHHHQYIIIINTWHTHSVNNTTSAQYQLLTTLLPLPSLRHAIGQYFQRHQYVTTHIKIIASHTHTHTLIRYVTWLFTITHTHTHTLLTHTHTHTHTQIQHNITHNTNLLLNTTVKHSYQAFTTSWAHNIKYFSYTTMVQHNIHTLHTHYTHTHYIQGFHYIHY
jgi:hypothetical protein